MFEGIRKLRGASSKRESSEPEDVAAESVNLEEGIDEADGTMVKQVTNLEEIVRKKTKNLEQTTKPAHSVHIRFRQRLFERSCSNNRATELASV